MTTSTAWQLGQDAAARYEEILTPVILGPFAQELVTFAQVQPGEYVVDVGCGTGAAARYAAALATDAQAVLGVDVNPGMIAVAEQISTAAPHKLSWRVADATQLPLDAATVDLVLCAQSLQFMGEKRSLALAEMRRVLKPTGRVAFSLWCALEESPYFQVLVEAISRHIGAATAAGLQSAFALNDLDAIRELLCNAGFRHIEHTVAQLDLPLPELTAWVPRHISATPMAASFRQAPSAIQERIVQDVIAELGAYSHNHKMIVPFRSHMVVARV